MTLQFETTPLLSAINSGSMNGSVTPLGQPLKKHGKLVLVDLAGSERLKVSIPSLISLPAVCLKQRLCMVRCWLCHLKVRLPAVLEHPS